MSVPLYYEMFRNFSISPFPATVFPFHTKQASSVYILWTCWNKKKRINLKTKVKDEKKKQHFSVHPLLDRITSWISPMQHKLVYLLLLKIPFLMRPTIRSSSQLIKIWFQYKIRSFAELFWNEKISIQNMRSFVLNVR